MNECKLHVFAVSLVLGTLPPGAIKGQDLGANDWVNQRIEVMVAALVNQSSITNQVESPTIGSASSSLVDRASAADVVGLALNPQLLNQNSSGLVDASSQTVTLTPYAILAAVAGHDPNEPFFYQQNKLWRFMSVTVGTEEEIVGDTTTTSVRSTIFGLKAKIWNPRELEAGAEGMGDLRAALEDAAGSFGVLKKRITDFMFDRFKTELFGVTTDAATNRRNRASFKNAMEQGAVFQARLGELSTADRDSIDAMIGQTVEPFLNARKVADTIVEDLRGRPQLSLTYQAKVSREREEHRLGAVFDLGIGKRWDWTINGNATWLEDSESQKQETVGVIATEFGVRLGPQKVVHYQPAVLSAGGRIEFAENQRGMGQVQAKFVLPLMNGATIPISFTWSNRTRLSDKSESSGRVSLAIDTSRILAGSSSH